MLINGGHLKPITLITTFGFENVIDALAYIRSGKHFGKIVTSNAGKADVHLPIRPALLTLQLQPSASYLIVGGLKGICGTLAIHMAVHGARHIIVNSRSGINDEASARIVKGCRVHGCEVTEARGDNGNSDFTDRLFKSANPRIAGIIQGAMVLRVSPIMFLFLNIFCT